MMQDSGRGNRAVLEKYFVTIQVPTFCVLLDLLSWHDAFEPFNPVANKTVEAAVAWAIPKQAVRCTDFGSGRLTIKPFPSPSRFAGDAAAMGRHFQELEDHLHQRNGHIRELKHRLALDSSNSSRLPSSDGWRTPLRRRRSALPPARCMIFRWWCPRCSRAGKGPRSCQGTEPAWSDGCKHSALSGYG